MRIGIIETGRPVEPLKGRHGDYPSMFAQLLGRVAPGCTFRTYAALDGELPDSPHACDGWLITGSAYGVYEPHEWIAPLEAFCREADAVGRPVVGICFGHQLVAQAFGGEVRKSDRGWGAGVHTYRITRPAPWMGEDAPEQVASVVSHQDQVVAPPPGAEVLGSSTFCPFAIMTVGRHTLAMQCHPEMSTTFSKELIDIRRERMGDEVADAARASLDTPLDTDVFARWIVRFFEQHREGGIDPEAADE